MSRWTHYVCDACYAEREPGREPIRSTDPCMAECCLCLKDTRDGIFYRFHPEYCESKSNHGDGGICDT